MYRRRIASRLPIAVLSLAISGLVSSCALFGLGGGGDDVKHTQNYSALGPDGLEKNR